MTPFGLYKFCQTPFGLKNAGMAFQHFMDQVLVGLPFVIVYLDNLLVASPDLASHEAHLEAILQ